MQSHPLDGDGVNAELFKFLARTSNTDVVLPLPFRIPDTILYYNCASFWFYFDEASKTVRKHPAKELEKSLIFDAFCKIAARRLHGACNNPNERLRRRRNSGIVCQFTSWRTSALETEYFTKEGLWQFLLGHTSSSSERFGLLQAFVEPKSDANECLQVAWSPELTVAFRKVNKNKIYCKTIPPSVRCCTFDGPSHLTDEFYCNPHATAQAAELCVSIVRHFEAVDPRYAIGRIVSYFKQDATDSMWLLYTSSIRIVDADQETRALHKATHVAPVMMGFTDPVTQKAVETILKVKHSKKRVLPPPRRLLGNFFTPSADSEDVMLSYAQAVQRRIEKREGIRAEIAKENERLVSEVRRLRQSVTSPSHSPSVRLHVSQAPSPMESSRASSPGSEHSQRKGEASGSSASNSRRFTVRSLVAVEEPVLASSRRHVGGARRRTVPERKFVPSEGMQKVAAAVLASGRTASKEVFSAAMRHAACLSDSFYSIGQHVGMESMTYPTSHRLNLLRSLRSASPHTQWTNGDECDDSTEEVAFILPRDIVVFASREMHELWESLHVEVDETAPAPSMVSCHICAPFPSGAAIYLFPAAVQKCAEEIGRQITAASERAAEESVTERHYNLMTDIRKRYRSYDEDDPLFMRTLHLTSLMAAVPAPTTVKPKTTEMSARAALLAQIRKGVNLRSVSKKVMHRGATAKIESTTMLAPHAQRTITRTRSSNAVVRIKEDEDASRLVPKSPNCRRSPTASPIPSPKVSTPPINVPSELASSINCETAGGNADVAPKEEHRSPPLLGIACASLAAHNSPQNAPLRRPSVSSASSSSVTLDGAKKTVPPAEHSGSQRDAFEKQAEALLSAPQDAPPHPHPSPLPEWL